MTNFCRRSARKLVFLFEGFECPQKLAIFKIQTFELGTILANPTKNRPDGRFLKLWLGRTQGCGDAPTSVLGNLRLSETRTKR